MSTSTYRIVLIADRYDPIDLIEKLIQVGVEPNDIHLSRNRMSPELTQHGVHFDVPSGVLYVQNYPPVRSAMRSSCGNCQCDICWPIDARVP